MDEPNSPMNDVRADVWLWAARFFKTRSLAKQAVEGGKVDVNGAGCKPARPIHVGDRLRVSRGEERMELDVRALSDKRGPAAAAQLLYRETAESLAAREARHEQQRLHGGGVIRPTSRPDKKARRQILRFIGGED
jgi:ribosome-associated heat shock protein Hsp15